MKKRRVIKVITPNSGGFSSGPSGDTDYEIAPKDIKLLISSISQKLLERNGQK